MGPRHGRQGLGRQRARDRLDADRLHPRALCRRHRFLPLRLQMVAGDGGRGRHHGRAAAGQPGAVGVAAGRAGPGQRGGLQRGVDRRGVDAAGQWQPADALRRLLRGLRPAGAAQPGAAGDAVLGLLGRPACLRREGRVAAGVANARREPDPGAVRRGGAAVPAQHFARLGLVRGRAVPIDRRRRGAADAVVNPGAAAVARLAAPAPGAGTGAAARPGVAPQPVGAAGDGRRHRRAAVAVPCGAPGRGLAAG